MKIEEVYPAIKEMVSTEDLEALNIAFERGKFSAQDVVYLEICQDIDNHRKDFNLKGCLVMSKESHPLRIGPKYSDRKGMIIEIN